MKFGVIVFPGSNCDYDCYWVVKRILRKKVDFIWHKERNLSGYDCLILPGGFSYGDYLRTGAIARFSPVMNAVEAYARNGGLIIGICNGFQVLLAQVLLQKDDCVILLSSLQPTHHQYQSLLHSLPLP